MNKYGFVNVTSANFNLKLADCDYNRCEIEKILTSELNTDIIVFKAKVGLAKDHEEITSIFEEYKDKI